MKLYVYKMIFLNKGIYAGPLSFISLDSVGVIVSTCVSHPQRENKRDRENERERKCVKDTMRILSSV